MLRELLHACLIAQDRTLGALTRGVDGEDSQTTSLFAEHVNAKLVDRGTLTCAWHTTDAYADTAPTIGQTLIDDLLGLGLMIGVDALDECHGLREDGDVALDDALYQLSGRELATTIALQVGVDNGGLLHTAVHLQACIFLTILWMVHYTLNIKHFILSTQRLKDTEFFFISVHKISVTLYLCVRFINLKP